MKIILTQDVFTLGSLGDEVSVKAGYGRNYLIPQGFAVPVTRQNVKMIEHQRALLTKKRQEAVDHWNTLAAKIAALELVFKVNAGESGKLFGSVTQKMIAEAIVEQGIELDRRLIVLAQPIKNLGTVVLPIRLHTDVNVELNVKVVADEIIKAEKDTEESVVATEEAETTEAVAPSPEGES